MHDALALVARGQVEYFLFVVDQLEGDGRMRQGHALELVDHVLQFHLIALEELPACGYVVEEAAHADAGACGARHGLLGLHTAALDQHPRAQLVLVPPGAQLHLRNGRDAGQRLAAETLGAHHGEVVGAADLAGGVALEAQARIGGRHALAIVGHLDQAASGVLHHEDDVRGARIHAVLQQFLHHAGRTLHHLARGDLVGHMVGQQADDVGHGCGIAGTQPGARHKYRVPGGYLLPEWVFRRDPVAPSPG